MVSNIALWMVVCVLSVLVFALMRQIGILHERVFPAGALVSPVGPTVGTIVPPTAHSTLANGTVTLGGVQSANTLLLFVSPGCPICKTLLPLVRSVIHAEHPTTRVLLVGDADTEFERQQHRQLAQQHHWPEDRYLISRQLGLSFQVDKLPFAVIMDTQGVLRAKGMVNSREHLESLFEAQARGVASLQEYLSSTPNVQ